MRPKLYISEICPSARAVLLTAKVLDLTLEIKTVPLTRNEGVEDYFKNTQQVIPTLVDSGYVIWDSHAIIAYLVGKYGKDGSLYPKDFIKRSVIDERLQFDSNVISFFTKIILNPMIRERKGYKMNQEQIDCLNKIYSVVEEFFNKNNQWIAGDELSIADLSLIPSITSLDIMFPIDKIRFPRVIKWIRKAETMSFYETNIRGLEQLKKILY